MPPRTQSWISRFLGRLPVDDRLGHFRNLCEDAIHAWRAPPLPLKCVQRASDLSLHERDPDFGVANLHDLTFVCKHLELSQELLCVIGTILEGVRSIVEHVRNVDFVGAQSLKAVKELSCTINDPTFHTIDDQPFAQLIVHPWNPPPI